MQFDFSAILLSLVVVAGAVWGLDRALFYRRRKRALHELAIEYRDPVAVDWARSLFPVLLIVLILRSFVAEPFRIPSGSMMPTLNVGDFILVNKFAYGLRIPAFNDKILGVGEPRRGDVVVFRFPGYICRDLSGRTVRSGDASCVDANTTVPNENWIKRVVGLPGDTIQSVGDTLVINGKVVEADEAGPYRSTLDRGEERLMMEMGATVWNEHLGGVTHLIAKMPAYQVPNSIPNDKVPTKVPSNCYLVMGDNRNNSTDSRWWGCLPEKYLVGKAFFIWLSWDGSGLALHRMGSVIH